MYEVGKCGVREWLAPAVRRGIQRELNLVVAFLDPRVGERHFGADGPPGRLLRLLPALLQPPLLGPLHALLGASDEARLRRVPLTERLEPLALPDDLRAVRQVVLAVRVDASLAAEEHAAHGGGFPAALVARVVRTRPPRRLGQLVLRHPDALRVDADWAQVAAHDVAAVPAVLACEAVPVIAASHLRPTAFLRLSFLLRLPGEYALLTLFQGIVVSLEHGVAVHLDRRLGPGPLSGQNLRLELRGDVLHALRFLGSLGILLGRWLGVAGGRSVPELLG